MLTRSDPTRPDLPKSGKIVIRPDPTRGSIRPVDNSDVRMRFRMAKNMFDLCWPLKVKVKLWELWSQISRKKYEIERKCQWKINRKPCLSFRMKREFLTSRDLLISKVKVKPWNVWSHVRAFEWWKKIRPQMTSKSQRSRLNSKTFEVKYLNNGAK